MRMTFIADVALVAFALVLSLGAMLYGLGWSQNRAIGRVVVFVAVIASLGIRGVWFAHYKHNAGRDAHLLVLAASVLLELVVLLAVRLGKVRIPPMFGR
jgi:hypothetical protein